MKKDKNAVCRESNHSRGRINIMLVITSISGAGSEFVVSALCKNLDHGRFNLYCCHLKNRGERGDELYRQGYNVVGLPGQNPESPGYLSFMKLRRLVNDKKIHILHTHDLQSLIDSSLVKILNPAVKLIHTFHFGNYPHLVKKYLYLEKIFSRAPDRLVSVGYNQKKTIADTFGIDQKKILTVLNGVSGHTPLLDRKYAEKFGSDIVIGSISTFFKQKGLCFLIEAAEKLRAHGVENVKVVLVGDGPLREDLELLCQKKGLLDYVFFTGWVRNANQKILPRFDIFVQSSLWEAFSIVILEAMAAGKPIITTNVGDNSNVVEHGKSGLVVNPGDSEALFQAVKRLLDDPDFRKSLGKNAQKVHGEKYGVEKMALNYERIYTSLSKAGSG